VTCTCGGQLFYYAAINEDGWKCSACGTQPGEPKGFSPALDRALIKTKVSGILHDVAGAKLIHVSNGSAGDSIEACVAAECQRLGRYDQGTILMLIVEGWAKGHADYWQPIADGIIAGNDPRDRCAGGRLATMYRGGTKGRDWDRFCTVKGCACGGFK
jgi:hypothetical protein